MVITKKQIIESGYHDVRGILEHISGIDVYSDGQEAKKLLYLLEGRIPIIL